MKLYMAIAPPWAQILPQPPPAAKSLTGTNGQIDQRAVKASGQLGARIRHKITRAAPDGSGPLHLRKGGQLWQTTRC